MSIGVAMKTFGTEFWKFYCKGSFFQKCKNVWKIFNILCLQAAITPQWLQIAGNSLTMIPLRDVSFPFLPLESIHSHSPGLYTPYKNHTPKFFGYVGCQWRRATTAYRYIRNHQMAPWATHGTLHGGLLFHLQFWRTTAQKINFVYW